MSYSAKIIADSVNTFGNRLTTMELRYPRMIHSEFMTHRVFSRNAASSRAIPIQKMISSVWNNPAIPVWIGKNQAGMQAKEELQGFRRDLAIFAWIVFSKLACISAWILFKIGMHKQIANRVLEPFAWITVIVSATEWNNFFALRCHPDAQPELQKIACMARELYYKSKPNQLQPGEYHLPLCDDREQLLSEGYTLKEVVQISIGRCARISYLTHDGKRDPKADIQLYQRLIDSGHMSPSEHVAQCTYAHNFDSWYGNFHGWFQYRKTIANENDFGLKEIQ